MYGAWRSHRRQAWIIAGAILVAAVLVVGVLLFMRAQDKEAECDRLRAKSDDFATDFEGSLEADGQMEALGCER